MRRNYSSRYNPRRVQNSRRIKSADSVMWSWIFIGMVLGLILAGVLFGYQQYRERVKKTQVEQKQPPMMVAAAVGKVEESAKPEFDFYNILPSMQVQVPVVAEESKISKSAGYYLQVASLQSRADVDKLKARLVLSGFTVNIRVVKVNNVEWTRVFVGPYVNKSLLEKAELQLQGLHLHGLITQMEQG